MNIREMRISLGDTQSEFARRYSIPFRTVQNWENGVRNPPCYVLDMLQSLVRADVVNRRVFTLPEYSSSKQDLPKRNDFIGCRSWLKAVRDTVNEPFVFALDEALMCHGYFGGHSEEYIVWVYGDDSLSRFNGIAVIGREVDPRSVIEHDGLRYTNFDRTLADSLANESILDMQGITEALSRYYYSHENSFQGICPPPVYQCDFNRLADDAIHYYDS